MGNCFGSPATHLSSGISQSNIDRALSKRSFHGSYPNGHIFSTPILRVFTFQELKVATRNFSNDALLGKGGFGEVYKGWLDERLLSSKSGVGMVVAVKKLSSQSLQGFEEWQSEVNFLGRLSHPNLVRLLGYCWEERELLLVYEFMQRGSLENHLFGRGGAVRPLSWDLRLKIVIGAARGIAFLHTSDVRIIYRDLKASNILLDEAYNAKISDFGLAKLGPSDGKTHLTTEVMGTYGYAAPEYQRTGRLYVKSDVYSFGVVMVELLTGLRTVDLKRPSGQESLVEWIKPFLYDKRKLKSIMDEGLEGRYLTKDAAKAADLALKCLAREPRNRPEMQEVVEALEKIMVNKEK